MKIPFLDLQAQYQPLRAEIGEAIQKVLDTSSYILGPSVLAFEKDFAAACGTTEAIGVNSGTTALQLALLAAGVGPGSEVILPAMTFIATASAVDYTGAQSVPVDVDPVTYTMDPAAIEAAITERTKVIMPVHLYGQPADMDPILEIARRHGLVVIEDAAQAHAATYKGRPCGSLGDMAGFSFYPGKNLGAYGEGGAITTSNPEFTQTIRTLRDWGQTERYHHALRGFNARMDGIQGGVLGVKLKHLAAWTRGRQRAAEGYGQRLAGLADGLPQSRVAGDHVFHIYALMVSDRTAFMAHLIKNEVACAIHYPVPVHLQPCFAGWGYAPGAFPVAESIAQREVSLPMFPELTDAQLDRVAEVVLNAPGL